MILDTRIHESEGKNKEGVLAYQHMRDGGLIVLYDWGVEFWKDGQSGDVSLLELYTILTHDL